MMSTGRILLVTGAFLSVVGLVSCGVLGIRKDAPRSVGGYKPLSGTVAEGFSYWLPREPFPRATCATCRLGKLKMGPFSLGAFRTLEIGGLVVNLPDDAAASDAAPPTASASSATAVSALRRRVAELEPLLGRALGRALPRLAGFRIRDLTLNRMRGTTLEPVLTARLVKSEGRRILASGLVLQKPTGAEAVPEAEVQMSPSLRLVWQKGRFDLP